MDKVIGRGSTLVTVMPRRGDVGAHATNSFSIGAQIACDPNVFGVLRG